MWLEDGDAPRRAAAEDDRGEGFHWEGPKGNASAWKIKSCPIGEGMVDWPWFASAIVAAKFAGPISQHFEYEIPGASKAEVAKNTIAAGKRDLAFIRQRFAEVRA